MAWAVLTMRADLNLSGDGSTVPRHGSSPCSTSVWDTVWSVVGVTIVGAALTTLAPSIFFSTTAMSPVETPDSVSLNPMSANISLPKSELATEDESSSPSFLPVLGVFFCFGDFNSAALPTLVTPPATVSVTTVVA